MFIPLALLLQFIMNGYTLKMYLPVFFLVAVSKHDYAFDASMKKRV